jgi:tRNA-intron endonuclease
MALFIPKKDKKKIKKKKISKKIKKKKPSTKKKTTKKKSPSKLKIEKTKIEEEKYPKKEIIAHLIGNTLTSNSKKAYSYSQEIGFGEHVEDKIKYTLSEGLFLVQNGKMDIYQNNKILNSEELIKKFSRIDKKFPIKYEVFKDLRVKGYVVKTALKFGAEFRVYEKGKKPGKEHSKWIVFTDSENNKTTWHEFAAKNRVAHSTNKNVLLAIVDEEGQITYYEIKWTKP